MLKSIDNPIALSGKATKTFFLYKLQHAHGEAVLENLQKLAENLPTTDLANQNLIQTIKDIKWIKDNNALMITGPTTSVDQVKALIAEFDVVGAVGMAHISEKSTFFIYKPTNRSPQEVQAALKDLAEDLEESGMIAPDLYETISTSRYVESSDSLLFTGTPTSLDRVKELLATIDIATGAVPGIQHIGDLTFLIYKLKYASADQLTASLKTFTQDLQKSNVDDKELAKSINNMKWIKETNSILFTGTTDTLTRIEALAEKFDIPSMRGPEKPDVARDAAAFVVYTPKNVSGPDLISILCDFEQNLISSGVSDPGLFDTINNLKWIDRTSSLLISGDEASMKKVQDLLARFDVPGKDGAAPSIESIDDTSFLVYKLKYHQGTDIQDALKKIAANIMKAGSAGAKAGTPSPLADAIDSLQWIAVTNSLLGTGQQDILTKLKDLIQSLDIPLGQVFIEVLVIETSMLNSQQFGLQWGSQMQYLNKATLGFGNFGQTTSPAMTPSFSPTLSTITATTTPKGGNTAQSVPFTTGFDLGVIGDIIMHKGKSFISLGSLVNALQLDNDTTIVMNPKLITQDNNQSTIFVGQNIPFTGSLVSNTSGSTAILTSSNVEYRDVGVSLTITPILGNNDTVTLDIVNDISEQTSNSTQSSVPGLVGLQTTHTHMETRVHVPNDHFVVLSGMINDSRVHLRTAIPCLGGLPIIGAAFSQNDRTRSQTNVIIFMRPHIINSFDEYKQITEHQEWLWKDEIGKSFMKEEFDHGIDMVKLPENE